MLVFRTLPALFRQPFKASQNISGDWQLPCSLGFFAVCGSGLGFSRLDIFWRSHSLRPTCLELPTHDAKLVPSRLEMFGLVTQIEPESKWGFAESGAPFQGLWYILYGDPY